MFSRFLFRFDTQQEGSRILKHAFQSHNSLACCLAGCLHCYYEYKSEFLIKTQGFVCFLTKITEKPYSKFVMKLGWDSGATLVVLVNKFQFFASLGAKRY